MIPTSVPTLNGTSYKEWACMMQALLQTKGLYHYIKASYEPLLALTDLDTHMRRIGVQPFILATTSTDTTPVHDTIPAITQVQIDAIEAKKKKFNNWVIEDDRILGAINMKCSATIQQINTSIGAAQTLWNRLEEQYGVTSTAGIFNDFIQATSWKFEDKRDPTVSINDLLAIINHLTAEGIALPENIQAMMVLAAVP